MTWQCVFSFLSGEMKDVCNQTDEMTGLFFIPIVRRSLQLLISPGAHSVRPITMVRSKLLYGSHRNELENPKQVLGLDTLSGPRPLCNPGSQIPPFRLPPQRVSRRHAALLKFRNGPKNP